MTAAEAFPTMQPKQMALTMPSAPPRAKSTILATFTKRSSWASFGMYGPASFLISR